MSAITIDSITSYSLNDLSKKSVAISYIDSFVAKNPSLSSADSAFSNVKLDVKNDFISVLKKRINSPTTFRQRETSLCGPTSFCYSLAKRKPVIFAKFALDIYFYGKATINELEVRPGKSFLNYNFISDSGGKFQISAFDWIVIGSIRNSENMILSYKIPTQQIAAVTSGSEICAWFEKSGAPAKRDIWYSNYDLQTPISNDSQSLLDGMDEARLRDWFNKLLKMSNAKISNNEVIVLINAKMIYQYQKSFQSIPSHWVVLESGVDIDGKPIACYGIPTMNYADLKALLEKKIGFSFFSWGQLYNSPSMKKDFTALDFSNYFFGYVSANIAMMKS